MNYDKYNKCEGIRQNRLRVKLEFLKKAIRDLPKAYELQISDK